MGQMGDPGHYCGDHGGGLFLLPSLLIWLRDWRPLRSSLWAFTGGTPVLRAPGCCFRTGFGLKEPAPLGLRCFALSGRSSRIVADHLLSVRHHLRQTPVRELADWQPFVAEVVHQRGPEVWVGLVALRVTVQQLL